MIKRKSKAGGFTMVELLVAMVILTVAILGSTLLVLIGMQRNNANRVDTTATNAAQAVLEAIAGTQANSDPTLTITDCLGNNLSITTAAGGAPLITTDPFAGNIDFSQAAVNGYQINYTVCGNNGLTTVYDVRWRVNAIGANKYGKLVTVAASQNSVANGRGFSRLLPVTLRTVVGI